MNRRRDDFNPKPGAQGTFVCSNNFPLGKGTPANCETDYPSAFMTLLEYVFSSTPIKCKIRETAATSKRPHQASDSEESDSDMDENPAGTEVSLPVPLQFEQLTNESDARFYTGLLHQLKVLSVYLNTCFQRLEICSTGMGLNKLKRKPPSTVQKHCSNFLLVPPVEVVPQGNSHHSKNFFCA